MKYILEGKTPIKCDDVIEWGKWYEKADRIVSKDMIGKVSISTVFLGIDHNFSDKGKPVLFETMIFGGEHDQDQWRYSTWKEAIVGHEKALAIVNEKEVRK